MRRRSVLKLSFLLCLLGTPAGAQITGSVGGTIRDASGAVLPGGRVTLKGESQHGPLTATSSASGTYRLLLVPPGRYEVSVELAGFAAQVRRDVEITINHQTILDFNLSVASVAEAVDVESKAPLVEVARSALASLVGSETIDALPLNGRNFVDLIALVPGAVPVSRAGGERGSVAVFGERAAAVSFLVDGAENNDPLTGGAALRYTQDSIREFEVITTGFEAEFGRAQGGVASVITRSGKDAFEAKAFSFVRNDGLDSSNVPNQDPPKLRRYQWGGTLSGPLRKDAAYFFGSFEVLDETRGVNIDRGRIPTFLLDGSATPGGSEDFSIGPATDGFTGVLKLDFNLGDKHRLSLTGNHDSEDVTGEISSPVAGTIALPSAARTADRSGTSVIARETAILSPQTFLESTAAFTHVGSGANRDRDRRVEPILVLLRSGFLQTGAPFVARNERNSNRFQLAQSLTHVLSGLGGDHQLKLGWDWNRVTLTGFDDVLNDVEYSAAFLAPDAHAINAELFQRLGFAQSVARFFFLPGGAGGIGELDLSDDNFSGFAQDTWRPRPDVTINAGLRYDYSSLFGDDKNNVAPRIGVAWDLGERHQTVLKANWGRFHDRNLLSAAATVPDKGGIFTRNAFDVALPRLGFDYTDSLIDLVITSGFPIGGGQRTPPENAAYAALANGLRSDPLFLYRLLGIAVSDPTNPPIVTADNVQQLSGMTADQVVSLLEGRLPGTDWEFFDVPGGSLVGNRVLSFFPRGGLRQSREVSRYSEDRTPTTNALSLGVEQQLPWNMALSVSYVHRRTRDLLTRRITNLIDARPGEPGFGGTTDGGQRVNQVTYDGFTRYDGVAVSLRKGFSKGSQFGLSYTWSDADDNLLTGNVGSTFSNNNHPEIDIGPSNQSAPHVFVGNGRLALPWDVTLSGILYWRSGAAYNPRGIIDLDGDGLVDQRDTTQPRNAFRTKSFGQLDLRLEKRVRVAGRHALTVLAEAFNLTNRANVQNVSGVAGPEFGTATSFYPGREIQLGLRYLFGGR